MWRLWSKSPKPRFFGTIFSPEDVAGTHMVRSGIAAGGNRRHVNVAPAPRCKKESPCLVFLNLFSPVTPSVLQCPCVTERYGSYGGTEFSLCSFAAARIHTHSRSFPPRP
jgi:hypothetical protein